MWLRMWDVDMIESALGYWDDRPPDVHRIPPTPVHLPERREEPPAHARDQRGEPLVVGVVGPEEQRAVEGEGLSLGVGRLADRTLLSRAIYRSLQSVFPDTPCIHHGRTCT